MTYFDDESELGDLMIDDIDLIDLDTEDDEMEDEQVLVVRGKWLMDGAETIQDAIEMLRDYASFLEDMAVQGYELTSVIEDDYGFAKVANLK